MVIFDFWLKSNNLQNVYIRKKMWHENFPSVKYDPSSDKRSGNQKVMIKVRPHIPSAFRMRKQGTIRRHGMNLLQDISMGS